MKYVIKDSAKYCEILNILWEYCWKCIHIYIHLVHVEITLKECLAIIFVGNHFVEKIVC